MDLICQCCKQLIAYQGKGRPPKYCPRCRPCIREQQLKEADKKRQGTEKRKKSLQKARKIYYKKNIHQKVKYNKEYYETHKELHARLRREKFNKEYHRRRYHRIQGKKRAQRKTRERPERQSYLHMYLKEYHKNKREKYHKRGTIDLSPRMKKRHGRPDFKTEMRVIQNQKKRLGL